MNDTNVVRYVISQDSQRLVTDSCFQSSNPSVRYVTHADYRALQDKYNSAIKLIESIEDEYDNEGYRIAAMATRYLDIVLDRKKP